jgi:hypothetical protein
MPECGQVQATLGVAIAKMQLAQRDALEVFACMSPRMIRDAERSAWGWKLVEAHLALEIADYQLTEAGAMIHPDGARYPRKLTEELAEFEASEEGASQCAESIPSANRKLVSELWTALKLAVQHLDGGYPGLQDLESSIEAALLKAEQFLGDPTKGQDV